MGVRIIGHNEVMALPYRSRGLDSDLAASGKKRRVNPRLARLSHYLDRVFRIPGTRIRFGIEPILGMIFPGAGDAAMAILSALIVISSVRYGLPKVVIGRMVFNVAVDYLLGSIPLLGDLFDFAFKANEKNLDLLDRYTTGERRGASFGDWVWLVILLTILGAIIASGVALLITLLASFDFRLL
ncbi:MAG TPA: DUF4112 domain-containing protein [Acidobacteriota bacterium]|nr:DUF4112 domain-containing protein [Acidobacteriota bacterium]